MTRTLVLFALPALCLFAACSSPDGPGGDTGSDTGTSGDGGDGGSSDGGSSDGGSSDGGATDVDWCASWHEATTPDGFPVVICEEAWPEAPWIELPASQALATLGGDGVFRDAAGQELGRLDPFDLKGGPESERHGFALYSVETDADGAVTSYAPRVFVDERRMLAPWLAAPLEGGIGPRWVDPDGVEEWAMTPSLPLRLEVEEIEVEALPSLAEGVLGYTILYRVANLDQAVLASDGSCLPALRDEGEYDPFAGRTEVRIRAGRAISASDFGNDELLLWYLYDGQEAGSMRSDAWYLGPEAAWQEAGELGTYGGWAHGSPGALPTMALEPVSGGGGPCG